MIVKLKEFGTSLGSRVLGKEVSNMINFEKEDEIILDFNGVKMVTSSFADEVVGKNCAKLGLHNFFDKVQIVNSYWCNGNTSGCGPADMSSILVFHPLCPCEWNWQTCRS